ncbi:MAG: TlpA family protein disulfide reductase [Deltaproteobacteria bacterium]|nr:TlpA family protein disulfide reductase [Deltaproteobacteria bacterium]
MSLRSWTAALIVGFALSSPALAADKASDFTLRDLAGQEVRLAEQAGKVVVLSFWATWCGPCKEEMPHLSKMYNEKKAAGLVVLSISTDDARSASKVKPFIEKMGYTFPVLLDRESTVIGAYNPSKTLPFTVIVDRQGNIAHVASGYNPGDEVAIAQKVDALLAL